VLDQELWFLGECKQSAGLARDREVQTGEVDAGLCGDAPSSTPAADLAATGTRRARPTARDSNCSSRELPPVAAPPAASTPLRAAALRSTCARAESVPPARPNPRYAVTEFTAPWSNPPKETPPGMRRTGWESTIGRQRTGKGEPQNHRPPPVRRHPCSLHAQCAVNARTLRLAPLAGSVFCLIVILYLVFDTNTIAGETAVPFSSCEPQAKQSSLSADAPLDGFAPLAMTGE
jgi:hypothetical protein